MYCFVKKNCKVHPVYRNCNHTGKPANGCSVGFDLQIKVHFQNQQRKSAKREKNILKTAKTLRSSLSLNPQLPFFLYPLFIFFYDQAYLSILSFLSSSIRFSYFSIPLTSSLRSLLYLPLYSSSFLFNPLCAHVRTLSLESFFLSCSRFLRMLTVFLSLSFALAPH